MDIEDHVLSEEEAVEKVRSASDDERPFLTDDDNCTEYSPSKQKRDDTEDTVLVDALKDLLRRAPSHVVGIGSISSRFPETFWGLNVARRHESSAKDYHTRDKDLFWRVSSYSNCDLELIEDISVERVKLRQSLVELSTGIAKMPMGGDFAVTMLSPAVNHLKVRFQPYWTCINRL